MDATQRAILIAVTQEKWTLAIALLRQKTVLNEFHASKRFGGAIDRVKKEFERLSGEKAYPRDFMDADRVHWDGVIAGFVELMGVGLLIEDMKSSAMGKRNILYFMSSEKGARPSRWDLVLMRYQEALRIRQKEKLQEADKDAMKKLGKILGEFGMTAEEPDWVKKMKAEKDRIYAKVETRGRMLDEEQERLTVIRMQLGKWEKGEF